MSRRYALGGTDVASICGCSPFRTEYDTFLEKTGALSQIPRTSNVRAEWGGKLQRVVADAYTETTGRPHEWLDKTLPHPKFEHGVWTPDALLTRDDGGLDAKTCAPDQAMNWGDPNYELDAVPDYVALQCAWYMSASDRSFWDIALLLGGSDFRVYRVVRDLALEDMLLERAREWWQKHIIEGIAPEITASDSTAAYLKYRHPRGNGVMRTPTGDEAALIEAFLQARAESKEAESELAGWELKLKAAIGDDDGFRWQGGKITYRRTKDSSGVDYESLSKWAASDDLPRLERQFYGTTRQGYRRLDIRVSQEGNG